MSMSSSHTKHALEALHPNIACMRHPDHIGSKGTLSWMQAFRKSSLVGMLECDLTCVTRWKLVVLTYCIYKSTEKKQTTFYQVVWQSRLECHLWETKLVDSVSDGCDARQTSANKGQKTECSPFEPLEFRMKHHNDGNGTETTSLLCRCPVLVFFSNKFLFGLRLTMPKYMVLSNCSHQKPA